MITGFGPYADRQELDFESNLKDKNMFVITGNTGAGKTTIFDAINFALYGEASGSEREGKSLRSDFAEADVPTEVELWFSLRGREYVVKRSPSYLKPKQRGEGFVESKPTAEIKLSKEKTVTGTKEVTKEIEGILGITTEQFKQLVMIPQGEFKKLLNAKSEEKEDIFRKIFGTEIFESIQKQIKEQASALKKGIEEVERDRLNKIRSFNCQVHVECEGNGDSDSHVHDCGEDLFRLINASSPNIELIMKAFYEFIEAEKEKQKALEVKIEEKRILLEKISNEIALGEATNKKFDNLTKIREELEKLNGQLGQFEEKKLQMERAKKALTARSYEEKYDEKNKIFKNLELQIKEMEKNIENYSKAYSEAELRFKEEKNKEKERNQLNKDIDENERLREKSLGYEANKNKVAILEKKVNEIKSSIRKIDTVTTENHKKIELVNKELEEIKRAKEEKGKLELKELHLNNEKVKLSKLTFDIANFIKNSKEHKALVVAFNKIDEDFKVRKESYEFLEDSFRRNQAGILASVLEEGKPCPVCGSTHHPELAKQENSEVTEEAVKISKGIFEKLREEKDKKFTELTKIKQSLDLIKGDSIAPVVKELLKLEVSSDMEGLGEQVNELAKNNGSELLKIEGEIKGLNSTILREKAKLQALQEAERSNETLRQELQLKNEALVSEEAELSSAKTTLENIKSEFKGEIKTVGELDAMIISLKEKLLVFKKAYEEAEKNYNLSKGRLDLENGKYESTKQNTQRAQKERLDAIEVFKECVTNLGFADYKDYKANSLSEEEIENINKEINSFNMNLAGAKKVYETSVKETEGLSLVDLVKLKEILAVEIDIHKVLTNEKMNMFSRIKSNSDIVKACESYNKAIEKDEKEYEIVGKLSNITNGDNAKKISFERYVLAAYFEDIIHSANIRFNKMTSGRFELLRKQDIGDKRKGQGLDLEVFDNYTGKARDIKTLSGGESFKASLAMALGLADVVQAYAGGIQLDTMFIDEGFGTLDPESLDNAIECLMDLQNDGRLVGIISHVAELKERINARLEVTSSSRGSGSKAEFRV